MFNRYSEIIFFIHLINFFVFNSRLFKLGAQEHDFAGPVLAVDVFFEPLFHVVEDDGGVGSMGELVVFESESDLGRVHVHYLEINLV